MADNQTQNDLNDENGSTGQRENPTTDINNAVVRKRIEDLLEKQHIKHILDDIDSWD